MTELLEQAILQIRELSTSDQDAIAALILDELADERQWDDAYSRSQDRLSDLAKKVRGDILAGRVREIGMDEL